MNTHQKWMLDYGAIFVACGLIVFVKVIFDILFPKIAFAKSLRTHGIEAVDQALDIQDKISCLKKRQSLLAFAELQRDQFKDRSGVILALVATLIFVVGSKDNLTYAFAVGSTIIDNVLAAGGMLGLSVASFAFLSTNQSSGAAYVCSVFKLACSLNAEELKSLQSILKMEKSLFQRMLGSLNSSAE